jgi:hypothetical protein
MSDVMKEINEKLERGSVFGTDELADIVKLIYDGWEELRDGFQITDAGSLLMSAIAGYKGNKEAWAEAMDLQDAEITALVNLSVNYNLGASADEARQVVKCLLVILQTYDKLINDRSSA